MLAVDLHKTQFEFEMLSIEESDQGFEVRFASLVGDCLNWAVLHKDKKVMFARQAKLVNNPDTISIEIEDPLAQKVRFDDEFGFHYTVGKDNKTANIDSDDKAFIKIDLQSGS